MTFDLPNLTDGNIVFAQSGTTTWQVGASADGTTSNQAGTNSILAGGRGSGTAVGGSILFKTSDAIGSGATLQGWTTKALLNQGGKFILGDTDGTTQGALQ